MRETAQNLLQQKASVDCKTKAKWTPLITASHFGSLDCVQLLVNMGADVNASTSKKYTALHHASEKGHTAIVDFLLQNEASPSNLDNKGRTALDIAIQTENEKIISLLEPFAKDTTREVQVIKETPEVVEKEQTAITKVTQDPLIEENVVSVVENKIESTPSATLIGEKISDSTVEEPAKPVKITDSGVSAELIDMVSKLSESNNKGFSMLHIVSKYNNKEMAGKGTNFLRNAVMKIII